jgi:hypothetical protein
MLTGESAGLDQSTGKGRNASSATAARTISTNNVVQ